MISPIDGCIIKSAKQYQTDKCERFGRPGSAASQLGTTIDKHCKYAVLDKNKM